MERIEKVYMMNKAFYDNFFHSELRGNQALYEAIFYFITSYEIRSGEFEGNEHVLRKVNQDNFILSREYTYFDSNKGEMPQCDIFGCIPAAKRVLIQLMANFAENDADLVPLYEQ